MKCPKCRDSELRPHRPRPDLEIDHCPSCKGVWLDKNELYPFVRRPNQVYQELLAAYKSVTRTAYLCPRCVNTSMMQALIPSAKLMIEACPVCGGNFFDADEIQKLNAALDAEGSTTTECSTMAWGAGSAWWRGRAPSPGP